MTQIQPKPLGPDAVGLQLPAMTFEYTDRDVILYALGVGASELDFVYERSLKTLPTFAVIPAFPAMTGLSAAVEINLVMVLHGEQAFRIHKTIPTRGRLTTTGKVAGVYDKGKGALATVETETRDDNGELIFSNSSGVFVRGAGRLGGWSCRSTAATTRRDSRACRSASRASCIRETPSSPRCGRTMAGRSSFRRRRRRGAWSSAMLRQR